MQPDSSGAAAATHAPELRPIAALRYHNRFVEGLPGDASFDVRARPTLSVCYARTLPTPVAAPKLLGLARDVAALLDLDASDPHALAQVLGGNLVAPAMQPFAACYGGHQFGNWAGQLGDGRALTLAEVHNARNESWELQLKGAGPTPYSRRADGRAVLRSSLREYVASEAMHHLGVPTTRALSLVGTGDQVLRDMLYDGNPAYEPGAVVCRIAPSFLRFGSYEIHASRGHLGVLRQLVDYTISNFYPELEGPAEIATLAFFREVCTRTARMLIGWMRVGFVHGVMNTDNMSILGLTMDYGPYGFLEPYELGWTPNTTDAQGKRYRYGNQVAIGLWNLAQLGNALIALGGDAAGYQAALGEYKELAESGLHAMQLQKLGFEPANAEGIEPTLYSALEKLLESAEIDMTIFFRQLAKLDPWSPNYAAPTSNFETLRSAFYAPDSFAATTREALADWLASYGAQLRVHGRSMHERAELMNSINPMYVPRNYHLQLAIDAAEKGDSARLDQLMQVLRTPYTEQPGREEFAGKRPEWARDRAGCSMLSCSS